jgi:hypothetical protein
MEARHDRLIGTLTADLRPVRHLPAPALRALSWLVLVAIFAGVLAPFANRAAMWQRLSESPDMWLAALGSLATMVAAALAAFELAVPDRSRAWALLPLPALALWVGASGLGCLRSTIVPGTHVAALGEAHHCLVFIVALSVPLVAAMVLMLRRAYPLAPALTAAMAGLAAAAASATLLNFFHPFDAAVTDLTVHAVAVALVVVAARALGARAVQKSLRNL